MGYAVTRYPTPLAFHEAATPFLRQREAEHSLLMGLTEMMLGPHEEVGDPLFFALHRNHAVEGAALRTGDNRALILSHMAPEAVAGLVEFLDEEGISVDQVNGVDGASAEFARLWSRRVNRPFTLQMGLGVFKLDRVLTGAGAAGKVRLGTDGDLSLLVEWARAFARETGDGQGTGPGEPELRRRIERRHVYLWEDGTPVCQLHLTRPTPNGMSVSYVYTPPEFRRQGYATSLVSTVSQSLLDGGKQFCFLFTDLSNPTSNSIYTKIGYRRVCDFMHFRL